MFHMLSLMRRLTGNPSVVLIDEFSTGIDAKMKQDMWGTLRNVAVGKAVVITTRASPVDMCRVAVDISISSFL